MNKMSYNVTKTTLVLQNTLNMYESGIAVQFLSVITLVSNHVITFPILKNVTIHC